MLTIVIVIHNRLKNLLRSSYLLVAEWLEALV